MEKKIPILIQNVNGIGFLESRCIASLKLWFPESDYSIHILSVNESNDKGYLGNILKFLSDNPEVDLIGFAFDDIFFVQGKVFKASLIREIIQKNTLDYLRLNARPPPHGEDLRETSGFRLIDAQQRYGKSVVTSFFTREHLERLAQHDIDTAWEIETDTSLQFKGVSYTDSPFFYHNLIVKGVVDPIPLARSGVVLSLMWSFKRMIQKYCLDRLRRLKPIDDLFSSRVTKSE